MNPLTAQILKNKRERRQVLARLSFPEKVRIVEQLRNAALQMNAVSRKAGLLGRKVHLASVGKDEPSSLRSSQNLASH